MKANSLQYGLGLICFHLIFMNHDHFHLLLQAMEFMCGAQSEPEGIIRYQTVFRKQVRMVEF